MDNPVQARASVLPQRVEPLQVRHRETATYRAYGTRILVGLFNPGLKARST
jgi:hypothetical protein